MKINDTIVIVDDDKFFCQVVEKTLIRRKFNCISVSSLAGAINLIDEKKAINNIKLFILDLNIENELDGLDLCRKIRTATEIPVVILTGNDKTKTVVKCLEAGANQYVVKPFKSDEFVARINAAISNSRIIERKYKDSSLNVIKAGNISINTRTRELFDNGKTLKLTEKETLLMSLLMQNFDENISRERISLVIYGAEQNVMSRNIDMVVARLRNKINRNQVPISIVQVRGYGYKLINE